METGPKTNIMLWCGAILFMAAWFIAWAVAYA